MKMKTAGLVEIGTDENVKLMENMIFTMREAGLSDEYLDKLKDSATYKGAIGKDITYQYFIVSEILRNILYWFINTADLEYVVDNFIYQYVNLIELEEFEAFIVIMKEFGIIDALNKETENSNG